MNRDTKIVRNTLMWIWNIDWRTFADVVFDVDIDTAPDHRLEYLAKYNEARITDPSNLFAMLDYEKMDKITAAAAEKYGIVHDTHCVICGVDIDTERNYCHDCQQENDGDEEE